MSTTRLAKLVTKPAPITPVNHPSLTDTHCVYCRKLEVVLSRLLGENGGDQGKRTRFLGNLRLCMTEIRKEILKEKVIRILAIILIILCPIALVCCIKVVKQYKRAVILRFGRVRADSPAGPGIIWVVPCTDTVIQIDLRTRSINLPPQLILTKDYVTANIGAVVNYRVYKPLHCLLNVRSHMEATEMLAISFLRNIVCTHTLTDLLTLRETISLKVKNEVGRAAAEWGVQIEQVEIRDIGLPDELQKAMAAEAAGRRTAKARIIACEGEVQTAEHLKDASRIMMGNPKIMLLRYLQTLNIIASQQSTIFFPFPLQMPELGSDSIIEKFLVFLSILLVVLSFPFSLACIFISVRQFERIVILRNGKVHGNRCFGPGMVFYLPCIDSIKYLDLRIMCDSVPPEGCLTKDSLSLTVQAVIYYKIVEPLWAIINVADFNMSTKYLAATALRNTIGKHRLSELLINRAEISSQVLEAMKHLTTKWGILVIRLEMNDLSVPVHLKKAMATEAVSLRLANAKVIVAQSEIESAKSLEKATAILMDNPLCMQLRYLQSLQSIAGDKTHTVVVPFPKSIPLPSFVNNEQNPAPATPSTVKQPRDSRIRFTDSVFNDV